MRLRLLQTQVGPFKCRFQRWIVGSVDGLVRSLGLVELLVAWKRCTHQFPRDWEFDLGIVELNHTCTLALLGRQLGCADNLNLGMPTDTCRCQALIPDHKIQSVIPFDNISFGFMRQ